MCLRVNEIILLLSKLDTFMRTYETKLLTIATPTNSCHAWAYIHATILIILSMLLAIYVYGQVYKLMSM